MAILFAMHHLPDLRVWAICCCLLLMRFVSKGRAVDAAALPSTAAFVSHSSLAEPAPPEHQTLFHPSYFVSCIEH